MSMANSLEVRTPFLDYRVVDFAFSLPDAYKINQQMKKRIVQDAFRHLLPPQIYNRPKHGFEVPITRWLQTDLKPLLINHLLHKDFIEAQNIFHYPAIEQLLKRLFSNNPADAAMQVWALLVFQWWWKQTLDNKKVALVKE